MVAAITFGEARAYSASPTGNKLAKPMLFRTSNIRTHPTPALWPPALIVAATASDSSAVALMPIPTMILTISLGSLNRLDHRRQKATAATKEEIETTESTVISQVVGSVRPKNTRLMLFGTQSR